MVFGVVVGARGYEAVSVVRPCLEGLCRWARAWSRNQRSPLFAHIRSGCGAYACPCGRRMRRLQAQRAHTWRRLFFPVATAAATVASTTAAAAAVVVATRLGLSCHWHNRWPCAPVPEKGAADGCARRHAVRVVRGRRKDCAWTSTLRRTCHSVCCTASEKVCSTGGPAPRAEAVPPAAEAAAHAGVSLRCRVVPGRRDGLRRS